MLRTPLAAVSSLALLTALVTTDAYAQRTNALATLAPTEIALAQQIRFQGGTDRIETESEPMLAEAAQLLARTPRVTIDVRCWTDPRGAAEWNQRLSQARADAIRTMLGQRGIAPSRVTAHGMGEITSGVPGCLLVRTDHP